MKLSPYFYDLRAAYRAELDDLVSDSEGNDVLRKRLAEKRNEIAFLAQMIELAPEMVAVVFHQGFRFVQPAALEHLVGLPVDELGSDPDCVGTAQSNHTHAAASRRRGNRRDGIGGGEHVPAATQDRSIKR